MIVGPRKSRSLNVVPPIWEVQTAADYSEGAWTPEVTGSSSGTLTGNFNGYYTKIGRLVNVQAYIDINSVGGAIGTVTISLPFRSATSGPTFTPLHVAYATVTLNAGYGQVWGRLSPGGSSFILIQGSADATAQAFGVVPTTAFVNTTFLYVQGTYATEE